MKNDITAESIINEALAFKDKVGGSDFPLQILPKQLQQIARATNQSLGYPIDLFCESIQLAQ